FCHHKDQQFLCPPALMLSALQPLGPVLPVLRQAAEFHLQFSEYPVQWPPAELADAQLPKSVVRPESVSLALQVLQLPECAAHLELANHFVPQNWPRQMSLEASKSFS